MPSTSIRSAATDKVVDSIVGGVIDASLGGAVSIGIKVGAKVIDHLRKQRKNRSDD
ncbi:MAG: hypothetical protein HeimC2_20980 [Candidatus Heimdallarchaeota archaeon LC_2]|nr:MAG: hypothetical protein HeimC2_20980 [Candidatus Heimdallarchaeota archaeon LC_2]